MLPDELVYFLVALVAWLASRLVTLREVDDKLLQRGDKLRKSYYHSRMETKLFFAKATILVLLALNIVLLSHW